MLTSKKYVIITVAIVMMTIFIAGTNSYIFAQEDKDSLWIHIKEGLESIENEQLTLTLRWEMFSKENKGRGNFASDWQSYRGPDMAFRVLCATDSAMNNIAKSVPVKGALTAKLQDLEWGTVYYFAVEPTNTDMPWRYDKGNGKFFKQETKEAAEGKKGGLLNAFLEYSKAGGEVMVLIYALAIFGLFFCLPLTWWKLRLANIFPPNKPGFFYGLLPVDQTGKTELNSPKGNVFLKEVAKYWGAAMQAMNLDPDDFSSKEEYIKASRQEQEEQEKRLWIEEGAPNVERAIEICRSGVHGIKLKKAPIEYPITRVLLAALENHKGNKNNWWASQEMDRATENTVLKEIDGLRGWSVSALWAIGSVEPMLGLFGTVIGIRGSFGGIEEMIRKNPDAELTQIVPQLAGGIHIALVTTITGLAIGVPFMLLYYYYRGKIDYIFVKWEEIVVEILNLA